MDAGRFKSLEDIDRPEVKVMVNPGGTNELLAKEKLTHATIVVHQSNLEIPRLIAVNKVIEQMKADGSLKKLHEKYGLVYAFE